jgi:uncharacterized protein
MKLLILADIDDFHWKHGPGQADIIVSCGDVSDQVILEAAHAYACSTIFAVKGNHDTDEAFEKPIIDLHLKVCEHGGIRFGGFQGSWRYKPRGHFLYDQEEVQDLLGNFPPVDIFLSHNSPRGIHDKDDEVHYGFDALNTFITKAKPQLVIHGHQHVDKETRINETRVIGVYGYKLIETGRTD